MAEEADREERRKRQREGWTVFHFDLNPMLTHRELYLGEAARCLLHVTGHRLKFWRCPMRGLSIEYTRLPATTKAWDHGETYRMTTFSRAEDEETAKRALIEDLLLQGINLYRALPNAVFDQQVLLLKGLLRAPVSINAPDWLEARARLHKPFQTVLATHQPELRSFLLNEAYTGNQVGPVAIGVNIDVGQL